MPRILVADDDPVIVHMLTALFQSEGFTVRTVTNGADLVQAATLNPPDLILTDVEMPVLDGIAATCRLRLHTDRRIAYLPIIVQSGNPTYQLDADAAGANVFLVKPVMLDDLLATVQHLLINRAVYSCSGFPPEERIEHEL